MKKSALQRVRAEYQPKLPKALQGPVKLNIGEATESVADQEEIKKLFPHTYGLPIVQFETAEAAERVEEPFNVGIILSGGQAPGGHNVVSGIFDGIKSLNKECRLYGFLMGPSGFINHQYMELTAGYIKDFRNTGGFDIIGSGRTKLETPEQFESGLKILKELNIKALVIIGGDDSNTNAAVLAEYYKNINAGVQVIGVPKTIDGDLKNKWIETSFGFDTACKVYSEVIGNIQRDCNSAKKYYHFIKLMGRSASHIALECALETQPNVCLISEEVLAKRMTLDNIVNYLCYVIAERAKLGWNFGTVLVPEGLIEFIPSMKDLISELNDVLAANGAALEGLTEDEKLEKIHSMLTPVNADLYKSLPKTIALQLSLDRDSHGNVQVSLIETESLLSQMVAKRLEEMAEQGQYSGKFAAQHHFFGYEGRCADPTNFDADYTYALGYNAAMLINSGLTGYMSSVRNLTDTTENWIAGGIPITMMMNMERRHGHMKPVIQKALVNLNGRPYLKYASMRETLALNTLYQYPGPIQYFGPAEVCDRPSMTLLLEHDKEI
ncbi:diphosphate--fructose-6-phosphate 1-phosphotransferase [Lepagella muris]|jgi:pyrophosphate--fructose-6-phosphate 1-phosphotransferase|uniref:Diphosphate--fructose-6-phosphate 1-phosphotransferase n=1 Tax=Lepagella muris TaxID=3032870 RepID=A0AC61RG78_9BACT|nr:diphosphate--fructose-6-phosphate 1-phosphotransferase [Lepagella muris]ROT07285.1 diphosphate--fructose-6-phosphate 1-phosphotransferase [Muribaculaceae bacterium Isolate-037 (Harlan)]TGY76476.1 diphosphate--fructose-6-phosphate 1-phosphotransferase [Lepagella muris]THG47633.1 diphosphate--fructose-6-phosphate 1-phosphotransferase [Bacteroidales bacterium]TKC54988.1 diphosphate--fructose-6-phosphate 1-phosphotransferase [Bacteroidales bacterium]